MNNILYAVMWFAIISGVLGVVLAIASKVFAVKVDERVERITELLPGANCGGCGYAGCGALAEAIVKGDAPCDSCAVVSDDAIKSIFAVMGIESTGTKERFRAQVMCSGTHELAKKKYVYDGVSDCIAAVGLAGGDKLCPNGCIGLGTCASACKFDAIHVENGVAAVDYHKCVACGACVAACPKGIIKLIPFEAKHWVGCMSHDKGIVTKNYCDIGCIGCKLCEKNCPVNAIKVNGAVAEIDYTLCTACDKCVEVCPRQIIWSAESQGSGLIIKRLKPVVISETADAE